MNLFTKWDALSAKALFNGLVFFAPVALLVRTTAGVSYSQFFLLQAILSFVVFLTEIPAGKFTDRFGYKNTMVLNQSLLTLARLLLFAAFLRSSFPLFLLEAIVEGVAVSFGSGTESAYLYTTLPEGSYLPRTARINNCGTIGFLVSTISYVLIYSRFGLSGLLLATVMITMQNFVGVGFAQLFGLDDPRLGLCMGSIPLVGGHGTSGSFGPQFEAAGVAGAEVVAIACATYGLVSGSLMGGPIARAKIKKYGLHSSVKAEAVETVETVQEPSPAKDQGADSILKAFILLIIAAGIGTYINAYFDGKITLPTYMGAMIVALIIRNVSDWRKIELPMHAIDISGNVCLNIFLAIALMTLKLWELAALAVPMIVTLLVQTLIMFLFASFIVFRVMGRDYEAACMTTAFCGFGMGATPNAMANMLSVTGQYGPAPKAFFVVPIVGGMFVDFTNTAVLSVFLNFLPK